MQFNDGTIEAIVGELRGVMDGKVVLALQNMRFIVLPEGINALALRGGNPAIYVNASPENAVVVTSVNEGLGVGPLQAVQSRTILMPFDVLTQFSRPVLYGILLHEMAHAWAERCEFPNTEHNAWLFEIQWVCKLATTDSDLGREMLAGLDDYFRRCAHRFDADATRHLLWTLDRLGLRDRVDLRESARINTLVASNAVPRGASTTPPGYYCSTCTYYFKMPVCAKHGRTADYRT